MDYISHLVELLSVDPSGKPTGEISSRYARRDVVQGEPRSSFCELVAGDNETTKEWQEFKIFGSNEATDRGVDLFSSKKGDETKSIDSERGPFQIVVKR